MIKNVLCAKKVFSVLGSVFINFNLAALISFVTMNEYSVELFVCFLLLVTSIVFISLVVSACIFFLKCREQKLM